MNWEEFVEKYKPLKNELVEGAPYDGCMFETYGEEAQFVGTKDAHNVWTLIDEEGEEFIKSGWHYVNRLGYFITENPWHEVEVVEFKEEK